MSNERYTIEYQTFESLMAKVEDDLSSFADNGHIEPDKYFGVVETCNSFLSTRINPTRECVVSITNCKGYLPEDFKTVNEAHVCTSYTIKQKKLGTSVEYKEAEVNTKVTTLHKNDCKCSDCTDPLWICDTNKYCCTPFQVWRKDTFDIMEVSASQEVKISTNSDSKHYSNIGSPEILSIKKVNGRFIVETNFEEGEMVVNYKANMVDEEGQLIVLDHPLVSPYYEYAIKERILEDLYLNSGMDVIQRLGFVKNEHRLAKARAYSFVSMYDFKELGRVWIRNRKHYYRKYFKNIM